MPTIFASHPTPAALSEAVSTSSVRVQFSSPSFDGRKTNPVIPSFDIAYSGLRCSIRALRLSQYVAAENVIIDTVEPGLPLGRFAASRLHGVQLSIWRRGMKKWTAQKLEDAAWEYVDAVAVQGKESDGGIWACIISCFGNFPPVLHGNGGRRAIKRLCEGSLAAGLEFAVV
ncbi:hypothetical protein PMIN06_011921 [Paraphaeosphaeria minitans]